MPSQARPPARAALLPLAVAAVASLGACKPHRKVSTDVSPPQISASSIPDAPASGKIDGAPFVVKTARYYVDQRRGFEKIDVILSASEAPEACGPLKQKDAASVWLRRSGDERVAEGEVRVAPDAKGPWEVHYQVKREKQWEGVGTAAALIAVRAVRPDKTIDADLSVCFGDEAKSCVSGSFSAVYCPIGIDAPVRGTEVPEPIPEKFRRAFVGAPKSSASPSASAQAGAR